VERIGVFGGTFDPPHLGHLILAEAAREQLALERVLWVVAGQSPLKLDRESPPVNLRVEMVEAAIGGHPAFRVSRADADRPGPHYSVDTLGVIAGEYQGADLYFIMGEDSLRDLPRWHRPRDFIAKCRLAVLQRPGVETDLSELETIAPGVTARVHWVSASQIEIASSDLRRRIQAGQSIRYLVPDAVRDIVEQHRLYSV
jgi:nicotinate-nucleotide adenylyltransferase